MIYPKRLKTSVTYIALLSLAIAFFILSNHHIKKSRVNLLADDEKVSIEVTNAATRLWKEDILYLNRELEKRHKNMYHSVSKEDFNREVDLLLNDLPNISNLGKLIRVKSLVAKVGDGHTCIIENFPPHIFPLQLFAFDDGIYVIKTAEDYKDILGAKLKKIGSEPIQNIMSAMSSMISRDNNIHLSNNVLLYLIHADMLHKLGYIDDVNEGIFEFETSIGERFTVPIESLFNRYEGKWYRIQDQKDTAGMKYIKNASENYWYEYLPEENLVYFQYNMCRNDPNKPIVDFTKELLEFLDTNNVQKFIFDMRLNEGGSSLIIKPLIEGLAENKTINQKGNLFVVIGRKTFSAAVLNTIKLKQETNSILIGEATAGKPNHFGEAEKITLPNTGLIVRYSTKYFDNSEIDSNTIYPDITVTYSFNDFINGIDPVLKEVLSDTSKINH